MLDLAKLTCKNNLGVQCEMQHIISKLCYTQVNSTINSGLFMMVRDSLAATAAITDSSRLCWPQLDPSFLHSVQQYNRGIRDNE